MEDTILARQIKTALDSLSTEREKLHVIAELTEEDIAAWLRVIHKKGSPT
jgi:hypothetical protein